MSLYEEVVTRMVECGVLIDHYAKKGADTLLMRKQNELSTLVRDWGVQPLREAVERYKAGAKIQTPE